MHVSYPGAEDGVKQLPPPPPAAAAQWRSDAEQGQHTVCAEVHVVYQVRPRPNYCT